MKADTGLLLCTGVNKFISSVQMCINAFTGIQRTLPVSHVLFFFLDISGFQFPLIFVMSTLNHMKPFTVHIHTVKRDR